ADVLRASLRRFPEPSSSARFLLVASRNRLREGDPEGSADHARRGLGLAPPGALRDALLAQLAGALLAGGHREEARSTAERALADGPPERRAHWLARRVLALLDPEPIGALEEALAEAPPEHRSAIGVALPALLETAGRAEEALGHAREAREAYTGVDRALMDLNIAVGLARMGRHRQATASAERAVLGLHGSGPRLF
ncbi:MAG: hypothetical protein KC656_37235, partial [Myxococcales bacterium]|nr:hypothetical protein [Myxococcales bacterium]